MPGFFKNSFMPSTEAPDDFTHRKNLLKLLVVFCLFLVGVMQTELFVSFYKATDAAEVNQEIKRCTEWQAGIGKGSIEKKMVLMLFDDSPAQLKLVQDAKDNLLNNGDLQKEIKNRFGLSFLDIGVVIVPSWQIFFDDNNDLVGITSEGWKLAKDMVGSPNVRGSPYMTSLDTPLGPRTEDLGLSLIRRHSSPPRRCD